jgi:hypothetical protein
MKNEAIASEHEEQGKSKVQSDIFTDAHTPYGRIPLPVLGLCQRMARRFLKLFACILDDENCQSDLSRTQPI